MVKNMIAAVVDGLDVQSAFYRCHPLVNIVFFIAVVGVTMFSNHPAYLLASFAVAWIYSILLRGKKALRFNCLIMLPVFLLTILLNTLNVHNGVTVLFYLNGNRITLEAIVYGCAAALMLSSAMIWFSCFGVIVTEDKFLYLLGRGMPTAALTLSMALRYIPLLKNRFREISTAQRCMGRKNSTGLMAKIRQLGKEVSILVAWSLEASIESADSMEARGYGLHGRTSFHLFKMSPAEGALLAWMLLLGGISIAGCAMGLTNIYYYPTILLQPMSVQQMICMGSFCLLMLSAVGMDLWGLCQWS